MAIYFVVGPQRHTSNKYAWPKSELYVPCFSCQYGNQPAHFFHEYRLLPLTHIYTYFTVLLVYKSLNKHHYHADDFHYVQHNYSTRNNQQLYIPRYNTCHAQQCFRYSSLKAWNALPAQVRAATSLPTIKANIV